MRITVIGATGMVGSRVVAEAVRRGHEVTAASRSGQQVEGAQALALDLADTKAVAAAIDQADATVIAVPPPRDGASHDAILQTHRNLIAARPSGRFLVVGGAGSLEVDGVRLKDSPDFPPEYLQEATTFSTILDDYRASQGLSWSLISPAPAIAPGTRTGQFTLGTDAPVGDSISAEDFAVAVVDELENPQHTGRRFTAAN